jgi:hypothetical protein
MPGTFAGMCCAPFLTSRAILWSLREVMLGHFAAPGSMAQPIYRADTRRACGQTRIRASSPTETRIVAHFEIARSVNVPSPANLEAEAAAIDGIVLAIAPNLTLASAANCCRLRRTDILPRTRICLRKEVLGSKKPQQLNAVRPMCRHLCRDSQTYNLLCKILRFSR